MKKVIQLLTSTSIFFSLVLLPCLSAQAQEPTRSIEQIIAGMAKVNDAFDPETHCYRIQFRQDRYQLDDRGKVIKNKDAFIEGDYARKGAFIYSNVVIKAAGQSTPSTQWITWDGTVCKHRQRDGYSLFYDVLPQAHNYFTYTDVLYIDTYKLITATAPSELRGLGTSSLSEMHVFLLPRMIAQNRSKYQLRPQLEQIEGVMCHVLEWPGHDEIYVDVSRGFSMRKRKMYFKEGVPAGEILTHDLFEAQPGLWLPRSITGLKYHNANSAASRIGKVRERNEIQLRSLSFDPLPDSFFDVPNDPSEKLLIGDNIRKIQYWRHPEGTDPVSAALEEAGAFKPTSSWRSSLLLFNGIGIGLISMIWLFVSKKKA